MVIFRNGHETVTEFLLSKAANVNYVNDDGYTALIYATESGQGHIVEVKKNIKPIFLRLGLLAMLVH